MKKPKVVVVELLGPPNSGKSTSARALAGILNIKGVRVILIEDQIRAAPIPGGKIGQEVERNLWAIRSLGNLIAEAKQQDLDLILVERGGWAILASLRTFLALKMVRTKRDREKVQEGIILAQQVAQSEHLFILFEVSSATALKRAPLGGKGFIINQDFLAGLERIYGSLKTEELPKGRTKIFDGEVDFREEPETFRDNQKKLLGWLLGLVEARANNSNVSNSNHRRTGEKEKAHEQRRNQP